MKIWPIAILGLAIAVMVSPLAVSAASSADIRLRILPMDCIFEVVNDGSNELIYLTPEKCGQHVDQQSPSFVNPQPPSESESGLADPQAEDRIPTPAFSSRRPSQPESGGGVEPGVEEKNVVTPLARIAQAGQAFLSEPSAGATAVVGVGIGSIVAGSLLFPTPRRKALSLLSAAKKLLLPPGR